MNNTKKEKPHCRATFLFLCLQLKMATCAFSDILPAAE